MKEKAAAAIAVMFSAAVCAGFFLGKIPIDLFSVLATAAIVWAVGRIEYEKTLRLLRNGK